jgi:hypothetical protein
MGSSQVRVKLGRVKLGRVKLGRGPVCGLSPLAITECSLFYIGISDFCFPKCGRYGDHQQFVFAN